jgi:hypothetical protein
MGCEQTESTGVPSKKDLIISSKKKEIIQAPFSEAAKKYRYD